MTGELSVREIGRRIYSVRGQRVMLDSDLAELYEVSSKRLNEQVRRNDSRFPDDFMFQLAAEEYESLRSQIGTLKTGRGQHRKYLPLVFTEQGVAMLSSVLSSERAVQVNIAIMRAFVKMRALAVSNRDFGREIDELERKFLKHDEKLEDVFEAVRHLLLTGTPPVPKRIRPPGRS
jgi:hypothetical protein